MRIKVEFEAELEAEYNTYYVVEDKYGIVRHIIKDYCTIIEEPVVYNVGDIVEHAGSRAIVYRVNDETLNVMYLTGDGKKGYIYRKYVKLLKKATYEEVTEWKN